MCTPDAGGAGGNWRGLINRKVDLLFMPWPEITHSCTAADGGFADPGVRIRRFVDAFGANGIQSSICEASFAPALTQVATKLAALIGE
jgi:hypothetical protein